ncbi:hypothetical protein C8R44DRAFT_809649 [Mycena epipterygia]|nr:hypothetical protein C8R44DRAFT_809649 [Mycena epipterygia]
MANLDSSPDGSSARRRAGCVCFHFCVCVEARGFLSVFSLRSCLISVRPVTTSSRSATVWLRTQRPRTMPSSSTSSRRI